MNKYLLLIYTLLLTNIGKAQSVANLLDKQATERPQEKVYVQFDKPVYQPGETIWFKAHVFAGYEPSLNSSLIYTELTDDSNRIIVRKVFPLVIGSAAGDFDIPPDVKSSRLLFRAYTKLMLNYGEDFYFRQTISVINNAYPVVSVNKKYEWTLRFFPEGGNLVSEIENRVAFQARDVAGNPVKFSGAIYNSKNEKVATIQDTHDGMGKFTFVPTANETYRAEATDTAGNKLTVNLPEPRFSGIAMQVDPHPEGKLVTIGRSFNNDELYDTLYVLVHFHQKPILNRTLIFENDVHQTGVIIPIKSIPAGVVVVTVFSKTMQPLAERAFFENQDQYRFPVNIKQLAKSTAKKGLNRFEIETTDTFLANLSVSVIDARFTEQPIHHNIYSGLLFSGDLRGQIHNPAQYFTGDFKVKAPLADLVMMTHGWRRYNWTELISKTQKPLPFESDSLLGLKAVIKTPVERDLKKMLGVNLQYLKPDGDIANLLLPPDGKGNYVRRGLPFYDSVKFTPVVLYKEKTNAQVEVQITTDLIPPPVLNDSLWSKTVIPVSYATSVMDLMRRSMSNLSKYKPMEQVTVKGRVKTRREQLDEVYTSGLFSGDAAKVVDLTSPNAVTYADFYTYLQGQAPAGLQIRTQGISTSLFWRNEVTALFLDQMPVTPDVLQFFPLSDVAYIKFFAPPFFGAFLGGPGGGVAVYSKRGVEDQLNPTTKKMQTTIKALDLAKEFYGPDYATGKNLPAGEDTRTTLYWNPFVLLQQDQKKSTIEFYNNDLSSRLWLVLEGVQENGRLIRIEKIIE
jgi:hypothetical protein